MDNTVNTSEKEEAVPSRAIVLPLLDRPLFPETFTTLLIGRPQDVQTITKVIERDGYFVALLQDQTNGFRSVGTLARVSRYIRLPNSCIHVFVSTIQRVRIERTDIDGQITWADFVPEPDVPLRSQKDAASYVRVLRDAIAGLSQSTNLFSFAADVNISNIDDPSLLSFYAASSINAPGTFLQEILETRNAKTRIEKLLSFIAAEKDILDKENEIKQEIYDRVRNRNREQLLREQIKALNSELSELTGKPSSGSAKGKDEDLWQKAKNTKLPEIYREEIDKELDKLSGLETMNPEYAMTKLYIETLLSLPFSFEDKAPDYSIQKVKKVLEHDHYGMKEVKERIVEFLASRLKAGNGKGAIICLAGPPGVGKTSIGYSIARALGKKIFRFSVGGMRDEAEIKGHRRTYVGAMPGKIIQAMKTVGVPDPVILIDEIDKMGESFQGDPASALLEVLDPEQNTSFQDFYIDLPYDLSKVLFIVTANDVSRIPEPLYDRMEVIELTGYTDAEKLQIAKKFLVPKQKKLNGLKEENLTISDDALNDIISHYTRESGVRNLEREISAVCRKAALEILENNLQKVDVRETDIKKYLGAFKYLDDILTKEDEVGSATGLAWTPVGGTTLAIDVTLFKGKGEVLLTGQLGDVMKESARTAISLVRSLADKYGIDEDIFDKTDIHIHVPEGAIPKDGPSAGITMATAILSAFIKKPVSKKVAMTGEITLRGKVLPIGGLKEKTLAAYRMGIKTVIIPKENEKDIEEIPEDVRNKLDIVLAEDISTVFEKSLVNL